MQVSFSPKLDTIRLFFQIKLFQKVAQQKKGEGLNTGLVGLDKFGGALKRHPLAHPNFLELQIIKF